MELGWDTLKGAHHQQRVLTEQSRDYGKNKSLSCSYKILTKLVAYGSVHSP